MACQAIKVWTFTGLVGAFLDLGITFLLLCVSALAFLTSKFLGLFGQHLPCPCDGLFGNPASSSCFQRVLVCRPSEKISSVQSSLKYKFPFDSILTDDVNCEASIARKKGSEGHVEFEGEESCNSKLEQRLKVLPGEDSVSKTERGAGIGLLDSPDVKEDKFNFDVKGFQSQGLRHTLRRRLKGVARSWSFSPISAHESEKHADDNEASLNNSILERELCNFRIHEELNENKLIEQDFLFPEDFHCDGQDDRVCDANYKNKIKLLKEALKKERAARVALLLELEKERSAAATAADEAMAMILRLQEEKACIEMESRQYQRMVEEKSAYDAEEMNILKEILMRREREKYCLEKEIGAYRQIMFESEHPDADLQGIAKLEVERYSSLYSSENPVLMPQQYVESAHMGFVSLRPEEKGLPVHEMCEAVNSEIDCCGADNNHLSARTINDVNEDVLIVKDIEPRDENEFAEQSGEWAVGTCSESNYSKSQVCDPNWETAFSRIKELEGNEPTNAEGPTIESNDSSTTQIVIPFNGDSREVVINKADSGSKDVISHAYGAQSSVYDVHVVEDASEMPNKPLHPTLSMPIKCDSPTLSWKETGVDRNRSTSGINTGLPPKGNSQGKPLLSDMRRNSMSAVDYERLKIDSEVGWLQERLRIVQESKEKLRLPMGCRERENFQFQILGDITRQLHGHRQLTEHGKTESNASFPPLLSKIMLKNRQWRSVSLDVHRSS